MHERLLAKPYFYIPEKHGSNVDDKAAKAYVAASMDSHARKARKNLDRISNYRARHFQQKI